MDILDRLRPRWRRSDPEVRAAAVRETGARDQARRETIARREPDARVRRNAADPMVRRSALARIEDPGILRSIAVGDGRTDLALHALERITDATMLRAVADSRTAPKSVRQRARTLLATSAGDRLPIGMKEGHARQLALCLAVESLTGTH